MGRAGGEAGTAGGGVGTGSGGGVGGKGVYALLMTASEPETALYRAPIFSLLLVSHGGVSLCTYTAA